MSLLEDFVLYCENLTVAKGKTWHSTDAGDSAPSPELRISSALGGCPGKRKRGGRGNLGRITKGKTYTSVFFIFFYFYFF